MTVNLRIGIQSARQRPAVHSLQSSGGSLARRNIRQRPRRWWLNVAVAILSTSVAAAAPPLDFESAPIDYTNATPDNLVTRLQAAIDRGDKTMAFDKPSGYLRATLKDLNVPESSQMLTFLKSSMQRPLIGPQNPRAVYFGDDAYVAVVPGGIIELIVTDPHLGMVFYTLEQDPTEPIFQRQVSRCMTCHSSSRTKNIPGVQVRSMMTNPKGQPVLAAGSFRTNHGSPLSKRWGGWFVTGTHGTAQHLGNFWLPNSKQPKKPIENFTGTNITDLSALTILEKNLTPHSDIVALMVFEHQVDAHNLITRTNYAWQLKSKLDDKVGVKATWMLEADQLVEHLLFVNEHQLQAPIKGTSSFAKDFAAKGPFDRAGRSLRQFDLKQRMFAFPCSYMLHSNMFASLPPEVSAYVFQRIQTVLTQTKVEKDDRFVHLSDSDKTSLLQILPEVVPGIKTAWRKTTTR